MKLPLSRFFLTSLTLIASFLSTRQQAYETCDDTYIWPRRFKSNVDL